MENFLERQLQNFREGARAPDPDFPGTRRSPPLAIERVEALLASNSRQEMRNLVAVVGICLALSFSTGAEGRRARGRYSSHRRQPQDDDFPKMIKSGLDDLQQISERIESLADHLPPLTDDSIRKYLYQSKNSLRIASNMLSYELLHKQRRSSWHRRSNAKAKKALEDRQGRFLGKSFRLKSQGPRAEWFDESESSPGQVTMRGWDSSQDELSYRRSRSGRGRRRRTERDTRRAAFS